MVGVAVVDVHSSLQVVDASQVLESELRLVLVCSRSNRQCVFLIVEGNIPFEDSSVGCDKAGCVNSFKRLKCTVVHVLSISNHDFVNVEAVVNFVWFESRIGILFVEVQTQERLAVMQKVVVLDLFGLKLGKRLTVIEESGSFSVVVVISVDYQLNGFELIHVLSQEFALVRVVLEHCNFARQQMNVR